MAGTNAGTGWPITFRCAKCRVVAPRGCADIRPEYTVHCIHTQARTGKTRPYRGGNRGARGLMTFHQYTCECGHTGWSRHEGVARLPALEA